MKNTEVGTVAITFLGWEREHGQGAKLGGGGFVGGFFGVFRGVLAVWPGGGGLLLGVFPSGPSSSTETMSALGRAQTEPWEANDAR